MNSEINNTLTFSIDRFEENFAVCENRITGEFVNIPKNELPENCTKGSVLIFKNGKYVLDLESTKSEQEQIKNTVDSLFKRKK